MPKFVVLILTVIFSQNMFAQLNQSSTRLLYEQNTLLITSIGVMENGVLLRKKPFGKDPFVEKLKTEPTAYNLFKKGRNQLIFGLIEASFGGGMVGTVPNLLKFAENDVQRGISWGFGGVGVGLVYLSNRTFQKATKNISDAIWFYNRAAILRGVADSTTKHEIEHWYDTKTIRLISKGYIQNCQFVKRDYYDKKLATVMQTNNIAFDNLNKGSKLLRTSRVLSWSTIAISTFGLVQMATADNRNQYKRGQIITGFGLGFAFFVISPINRKAANHINRAVWFYNRDSML